MQCTSRTALLPSSLPMPPSKSPRLAATSKAPTPILFREVQPNWNGLFSRFAELDLTKPGQWLTLLPGTVRDLFTLKPRSTNEEVFLLVKRALARAAGEL